jgi:hypothetical protein
VVRSHPPRPYNYLVGEFVIKCIYVAVGLTGEFDESALFDFHLVDMAV